MAKAAGCPAVNTSVQPTYYTVVSGVGGSGHAPSLSHKTLGSIVERLDALLRAGTDGGGAAAKDKATRNVQWCIQMAGRLPNQEAVATKAAVIIEQLAATAEWTEETSKETADALVEAMRRLPDSGPVCVLCASAIRAVATQIGGAGGAFGRWLVEEKGLLALLTGAISRHPADAAAVSAAFGLTAWLLCDDPTAVDKWCAMPFLAGELPGLLQRHAPAQPPCAAILVVVELVSRWPTHAPRFAQHNCIPLLLDVHVLHNDLPATALALICHHTARNLVSDPLFRSPFLAAGADPPLPSDDGVLSSTVVSFSKNTAGATYYADGTGEIQHTFLRLVVAVALRCSDPVAVAEALFLANRLRIGNACPETSIRAEDLFVKLAIMPADPRVYGGVAAVLRTEIARSPSALAAVLEPENFSLLLEGLTCAVDGDDLYEASRICLLLTRVFLLQTNDAAMVEASNQGTIVALVEVFANSRGNSTFVFCSAAALLCMCATKATACVFAEVALEKAADQQCLLDVVVSNLRLHTDRRKLQALLLGLIAASCGASGACRSYLRRKGAENVVRRVLEESLETQDALVCCAALTCARVLPSDASSASTMAAKQCLECVLDAAELHGRQAVGALHGASTAVGSPLAVVQTAGICALRLASLSVDVRDDVNRLLSESATDCYRPEVLRVHTDARGDPSVAPRRTSVGRKETLNAIQAWLGAWCAGDVAADKRGVLTDPESAFTFRISQVVDVMLPSSASTTAVKQCLECVLDAAELHGRQAVGALHGASTAVGSPLAVVQTAGICALRLASLSVDVRDDVNRLLSESATDCYRPEVLRVHTDARGDPSVAPRRTSIGRKETLNAIQAWLGAWCAGDVAADKRGVLTDPESAFTFPTEYKKLRFTRGRLSLDRRLVRTLTGQQSAGSWDEVDYIHRETGRKPAILGLDSLTPYDNVNVVAKAKKWYLQNNGIVSICWHWGAPDVGTGYENSKVDFDLAAALTPGTTQNRLMLRDLDEIAAGVPVLWRPLHEFTGTWFWWGKHGAAGFVQLWRFVYDYYTHAKHLNNLVWVLGYSHDPEASFYPGNAYIDIAGADVYAANYQSQVGLYDRMVSIVGDGMPIPLHENGHIPDPNLVDADGAHWSWFLTWHTRWLKVDNPVEWLKFVFNHDKYITLDELPPLATYNGGSAQPPSAPSGPPPPGFHVCDDVAPSADFTCAQQASFGKCSESWMVASGRCRASCGDCAPPPATPAPPRPVPGCTDIPPSTAFTCPQQASWGKCGETWMQDRCHLSCGRCAAAPIPPPTQRPPLSVCTDIPPTSAFTCPQQASWGKCGEPWMQDHCHLSCARCVAAPTPSATQNPPLSVCTDIPPTSAFTCPQQASWGKCGELWMQDNCNESCGRCGAVGQPQPPLPPPARSPCTDVAPTAQFTCPQQAGWGKCAKTWMRRYCHLSCGRCSPGPVPCTDVPPSQDFTCAQQAGWGKCGEAWMRQRCHRSCGRC
ncbi:Mannan endo-1 [Diplonema papillatum]|nr:Mannan endo-1 [Diplonema papillatum]